MSADNHSSNHLSLAKFAFNIYGTLNQTENVMSTPADSIKSKLSDRNISPSLNHNGTFTSDSSKLVYNCEREVSCLSELNYPLHNIVESYNNTIVPSHHVIIGGKNYLKLLALNNDQSSILNEINILDQNNTMYNKSRIQSSNKLTNVNTIKSQNDLIACGLSSGGISIYKMANNGKSKLITKLNDHKRCINSLDFITDSSLSPSASNFENSNQLLSGSQDGSIKLWDLRSASLKPVMSIVSSSHSDPIRSCQYSPHSSVKNKLTVLSVHDSGSLCKYDLRSQINNNNAANFYNQSQHQISMPEKKWNFHTGPALSLHIHPEKEFVITGGRDKKLCIWNYGDSISHQNKVSPDYMVNTYGPVMKVRWSQYQNTNLNTNENWSNNDDFIDEFDNSIKNNPLSNYDFACLYLNEDTTITVYNLKRKYIPQEIISTTSHKPFQNFIWSKNNDQTRKLWTITKSNIFASYNLDSTSSSNVMRPLEHLSNISVTWNNGLTDFCFVSQKKNEFQYNPNTDHDSSSKVEFDNDHSNELNENKIHSHNSSNNISGGNFVWDETSNDNRNLEHQSSAISLDNSYVYNQSRLNVGSVPVAINSLTSPLTSSPIEKPNMIRSNSHAPLQLTNKASSPISQPRNANPMDIYSGTGGYSSSNSLHRPHLKRNNSQSTQGSGKSLSSSPIQHNLGYFPHQHQQRKIINVTHPSPYLVPISIPIPLNDEQSFKSLSDAYLMEVPESFNIMDVCLINARIAAGVNKFRDCQIWRLLAISLEQESIHYEDDIDHNNQAPDNDNGRIDKTKLDDHGRRDSHYHDSILSDLGNLVGSYNSNSTLTTNYGGNGTGTATGGAGTGNSVESRNTNSLSTPRYTNNFQAFTDPKNNSSQSLIETHNRSNSINPSPSSTRPNMGFTNNNTPNDFSNAESNDNESAVIADDDDDNNTGDSDKLERSSKQRSESDTISPPKLEDDDKSNAGSLISSPMKVKAPEINMVDPDGSPRNITSGRFYPQKARHSFGASTFQNRFSRISQSGSEDLDNENFNMTNNISNVMTNNAFFQTPQLPGNNNFSHYSQRQGSPHHSHYSGTMSYGSNLSRRNSAVVNVTHGFLSGSSKSSFNNVRPSVVTSSENKDDQLLDLDERPEDVRSFDTSQSMNAKSKLTEAFSDTTLKEKNPGLAVPWRTANLLYESLDYAKNQGDIIMSSTLILLFYQYFNEKVGGKLNQRGSLECISLYVEILRKKQLFINAVNVIKVSPPELRSELSKLTNNEVNLRFYCSWCEKLLVNEKSKINLNNGKGNPEEFGYWYCDNCSKKQHNCIYCNEPCKGLNVVISLRCGHRGHFGCLREWFVDDENLECPGGCDELVFV